MSQRWQTQELSHEEVLIGMWVGLVILAVVAVVAVVVAFHRAADPMRHCELVHQGVYDKENRSCQLPDGRTLYGQ